MKSVNSHTDAEKWGMQATCWYERKGLLDLEPEIATYNQYPLVKFY